MRKAPAIQDEAFCYLKDKAPVLFFILSAEGKVLEANTYADHAL